MRYQRNSRPNGDLLSSSIRVCVCVCFHKSNQYPSTLYTQNNWTQIDYGSPLRYTMCAMRCYANLLRLHLIFNKITLNYHIEPTWMYWYHHHHNNVQSNQNAPNANGMPPQLTLHATITVWKFFPSKFFCSLGFLFVSERRPYKNYCVMNCLFLSCWYFLYRLNEKMHTL